MPPPSTPRSEVAEQLFLLDTRGWCVVEDALSLHEVQRLLDELQHATQLDSCIAGRAGELMQYQSKPDGTVRRWPFPYHYGPGFTALIDNPRITPLLHGRLGAEVKLDHEYVQTLKPSGGTVVRGGIHGGPANHATSTISGGIHGGPEHRLQSAGAITGSGNGELITVVYKLLDVAPEDGGFGAVVGQQRLPVSSRAGQSESTHLRM
eukprot:SAG11_NODE_4467_length_1885_cov_1.603024_3_plen_207_part_00